MLFTIIVILIIALVILAIVINAIQQHKEEQEAIKRREMNKVKRVLDESETILTAAGHLPTPSHVVSIINNRMYNALLIMEKLNPKAFDIKQRIEDAQSKATIGDVAVPAEPPNFPIPDKDKLLAQVINTIKKVRLLMRSEYNKGRVPANIYTALENYYDIMQMRINIETLFKRGENAIASNMLGSARQYFEKCIKLLESNTNESAYIESRKVDCNQKLQEIQNLLRAEQMAVDGTAAADPMDEQFETKTKW